MPMIGEVKHGKELGYKNVKNKFTWCACSGCGKERWVYVTKNNPAPQCRRCCLVGRFGVEAGRWNGGRSIYLGYVFLWVSKDDFYRPMANTKGYAMEHRLVMAKSLGRCLQVWELVHHKNGVKDDNRIENLELDMRGSHSISHSKGYRDGYTKGLQDGKDKQVHKLKQRVVELEQRVTLLEAGMATESNLMMTRRNI